MLKPLARKAIRLPRTLAKILANPIRKQRLHTAHGLRVHLGCGPDRLPGFTQLDCRADTAADVLADLNEPSVFSPGSVDCFYSHAFFEHLFRDSRLPHLKALHSALSPSGFVCYIGLPYFPEIARQYLSRGPGCTGPTFNLFEVYRLTHGHPELMPSHWVVQLHKSLFDEEELAKILRDAGYSAWTIFQYAFRDEPVAVSCGFYASKEPKTDLQASCRSFLAEVAPDKVNLDSIRFIA